MYLGSLSSEEPRRSSFGKPLDHGLFRTKCGNGLDLDLIAMPELLDRHNRARRPALSHHSGVRRVDSWPQIHIRDVDRHLKYVVQAATGRFEDGVYVLQGQLRLLLDGADLRLPSVRENWKLTGDEYQPVVNDCLRVVTCRRRSVGRFYTLHRTHSQSG